MIKTLRLAVIYMASSESNHDDNNEDFTVFDLTQVFEQHVENAAPKIRRPPSRTNRSDIEAISKVPFSLITE